MADVTTSEKPPLLYDSVCRREKPQDCEWGSCKLTSLANVTVSESPTPASGEATTPERRAVRSRSVASSSAMDLTVPHRERLPLSSSAGYSAVSAPSHSAEGLAALPGQLLMAWLSTTAPIRPEQEPKGAATG